MGKQKKQNNISKVQINLEWIFKIRTNTYQLKNGNFGPNLYIKI